MNNAKNPFSPEERLYALYGRNPPVQVLGRFKTERILLRGSFYDDLELVSSLREAAQEAGTDVSCGGNLGASFIAWLRGCTDVNPLPPHYFPGEGACIFCSDGDGWDLPPLKPEGDPRPWDGHDIPLESMTPRMEVLGWGLELHLAPSFAEKAVGIIQEHYRGKRCTLIPCVIDSSERDDLIFVVIPQGEPIPGLSEDGFWHTDSETLYNTNCHMISMVRDERKEQIRTIHKKIPAVPSIRDLLVEPVLASARAKIRSDITQEGGTLLESDKLRFSSLLQEYGYLHSLHTGDNPVYLQEDARCSDVFAYREQVWHLIQNKMNPEYGLSSELPLFITKRVRMGRFTRNRMDPETEKLLRGLEIPDHWIEQMKHTMYLPCKADLISSLLDVLKLTWYELQKVEE